MQTNRRLFAATCSAVFVAYFAHVAKAEPYDTGRYTAPPPGPVNTWWIETPGSGLVVIDAQRDADNAAKAIAGIRASGKPVRAILLTHSHPDHVGGLQLFKDAFPDAKIYAQAATAREMRDDTQTLLALSAKASGLPQLDLPAPLILAAEETLTIDGAEVQVKDYGEGESVSASVFYLPGANLLVSGDIVTAGLTPFLAEGRAGKWITQTEALLQSYPAAVRVLPGHGEPASLTALAETQLNYLRTFKARVAAALAQRADKNADLDGQQKAAVNAEIQVAFPYEYGVAGLPLGQLRDLNIEAVAREIETGRSGFSAK